MDVVTLTNISTFMIIKHDNILSDEKYGKMYDEYCKHDILSISYISFKFNMTYCNGLNEHTGKKINEVYANFCSRELSLQKINHQSFCRAK